MEYNIEITTSKTVQIEAESEQDAIAEAKEMALGINDFDWEFYAE